MESASKDVLMMLALELSNKDIVSLCLTSKKFNNLICQNEIFWLQKIRKEFPNEKDIEKPYKETYKKLSKLTPKEELTNKRGKYYNFWKGEISGQLSDGQWENEPYIPGYSNFTEVMDYISDRLLLLGAASRIGLNIKDDPWIEDISWMFYKYQKDFEGDLIEIIKTHDMDKVLDDFLGKEQAKGNKYWINAAQRMIKNKEKMRLIWNYIQSGKYDFHTLYKDLDEFNTFYVENRLYIR